MTNGQIYSDSMRMYEWRFYKYELMQENVALQVWLNETVTDTNTDCDIFIQINDYPTRTNFFMAYQGWKKVCSFL